MALAAARFLQRGCKNRKAAVVAYETVLRVDPSATDIALRLADLYSQKRETAQQAIALYQRLLVTGDQVVPARKLFELYSGLDQLDRAYCALGALVMLRAANETEVERTSCCRSACRRRRPVR